MTTPPNPTEPSEPAVLDRYTPLIAIAAMIGTFVAIPPSFAMTLIAAIWLGVTRGLGRPKVFGLTLTEALAWAATIAIVEFLAALVLFVAGGGLARGA